MCIFRVGTKWTRSSLSVQFTQLFTPTKFPAENITIQIYRQSRQKLNLSLPFHWLFQAVFAESMSTFRLYWLAHSTVTYRTWVFSRDFTHKHVFETRHSETIDCLDVPVNRAGYSWRNRHKFTKKKARSKIEREPNVFPRCSSNIRYQCSDWPTGEKDSCYMRDATMRDTTISRQLKAPFHLSSLPFVFFHCLPHSFTSLICSTLQVSRKFTRTFELSA